MTVTPNRNLADILLSTSNKYPDKTVIQCSGESYSYKQLLEQACSIALDLEKQGIQRGDRIAIYMDNTWPCVVALFAITMSGAVFLLINPQTKNDKLKYILEDSGSKVLLSDAHLQNVFVDVVNQLSSITDVYCSGNDTKISFTHANYHIFENTVTNNDASLACGSKALGNDLAALIYTSGSTGFPKGVMQSHQSILFSIESLVEYLRLSHSDRIINFLPFAFDYGLYQLFFTVYLGATLILERSFTYPAVVYNLLRDTKATVFPGVPTIYSMLLKSHAKKALTFPDVTRITNTAAALPAEYVSQLQEIFPNALIYKMYGLTECKRVCYLEPELVHQYPSSVGTAIPGTEIFLFDENDKPVKRGGQGILHVRGPHIMMGYWNKPDESKKMLKAGLWPGEKILCTHDLFKVDENGLHYFIGRSDDIIKTRGEKVSPIEVENVLHGINGIKDAAIIGVADDVLGEVIHAYVSLTGDKDIAIKDIKKVCVQKLENFMVPAKYHIVDDLPKSTNGKIDKKMLQVNL